MERCCDLCGNIGFNEVLISCRQCKSSFRHMYCMRIVLEEPSDDWLCEDCDGSSRPMPLSPSSKSNAGSPKGSKVTNTKRVRFADTFEELPKTSREGLVNWEKKVSTGKTKYISVTEAVKLSAAEKSLHSEKVSSRSRSFKQPKVKLNRSGENPYGSPTKPPTNVFSQKDLHSRPSYQLKRAKLPNLDVSDAPRQSGGNICPPIELVTSSPVNMHGNSLAKSWTPALDDLWKGSFKIDDKLKPGKLNLHIRAHPPSHVHRKAYEFSKQMPEILHLEFTPRDKLWSFDEYFPEGRDIGLYFFSHDSQSSEDYVCLLEYITRRNLALRMLIGYVELQIFPSKFLPVDNQCWRGKHFLWGVFHCLERHPSANKLPLEPLLQTSDASNSRKHDESCDNEVIDMDIDMIGDVDVGTRDIVVPRNKLDEKECVFKEGAGKISFSQDDDIPPGFEGVCR